MGYDAAMLLRFSTAVRARTRAARPLGLPHLWVMTDEARTADPVAVARRLPAGSALVLRHRDAADRARLARRLAPVCVERRVALVIAGDWRLAAACRAAGVHLSEAEARRGPAVGLRLWRKGRLLTAAAHGAGATARGRALDVDAVLLGAVLPTPSHRDRAPLGVLRAAAIGKNAKVAIVALGGLSPLTLGRLNEIPIAGVAGVGFAQNCS
jgi:thiamine-phosphate pyrophosphorylase